MGEELIFSGTWEILKCCSLSSFAEAEGIEGTRFTLTEGGDMKWAVAPSSEPMPFFECETYEVYYNDCNYYLRLYGINAGYSIEFKVEQTREEGMELTYEGWCVVHCERVDEAREEVVKCSSLPFSFIGAFQEGYFADRIIRASNGREFRVHRLLLHLANPSLDWYSEDPLSFEGLSERVLEAILHYLYSECLPTNFTENIAEECLEAIEKLKVDGFQPFVHLCQVYIKNSALKKRIFNLIQEMHEAAKEVIDNFSRRQVDVTGGANSGGRHRYSRLVLNMKQALSETAVVAVKFLIICDIYSQHKSELTPEEQQEIIKYCKSRLPIAMFQIHQLFEVIKKVILGLTVTERMELASFLVPEYEAFSSVLPELAHSIDTTLLKLIEISDKLCYELNINDLQLQNNANSSHHNQSSLTQRRVSISEALSRSLKLALHVKELKSLRNLHYVSQQFSENLLSRRDNFAKITVADKIRCLAKTVEQFADEIPLFLLRVDEFGVAVDERLSWKDWKYLFKVITAKVARVLSKLRQNKDILQPLLSQLCDMVTKEQFTNSLIQLGLYSKEGANDRQEESQPQPQPLPQPQAKEETIEANETNEPLNESNNLPLIKSPKEGAEDAKEEMIYQSLCEPPSALYSRLAKKSAQLLKRADEGRTSCDLFFELYPLKSNQESIESEVEKEGLSPEATSSSSPAPNSVPVDEGVEATPVIIKGHCVIVAARCEWFKRALLSGMKESINKTIRVLETDPELFAVFLEYLYSGLIEANGLTTDELAELMQLSDRYEVDCLKRITEACLLNHVDEDSALFLLTVADQFSAATLRSASLEYITQHKDVVKSDLFQDLPEDLQSEVEEVIMWSQLRGGFPSSKRGDGGRDRDGSTLFPPHLRHDNSSVSFHVPSLPTDRHSLSSLSSSIADIEDLASALHELSSHSQSQTQTHNRLDSLLGDNGSSFSRGDEVNQRSVSENLENEQRNNQYQVRVSPDLRGSLVGINDSGSGSDPGAGPLVGMGQMLPETDSQKIEECLSRLREVVGEEVPREELIRITLAADYDLNRALNFFFS